MKTVGIIGGLGPETTSKFYLETVFACFEKDKADAIKRSLESTVKQWQPHMELFEWNKSAEIY